MSVSVPDQSSSRPSTAPAERGAESARGRAPRSGRTRRRLLEAGRRLFAEHGPRAVTSHAIAAEAGFASGTFYLHFPDKLALFRELADEAATEIELRLSAAATSKTEPWDAVYAQADALVGFATEHRDLLRIVFHPGDEGGDVGAQILERLARGVSARRRERLGPGSDSDCFDPDVLAQAIVGLWAHVLAWWAEDPSRASREALTRTLTHFQMHGSRSEAIDPCGFLRADGSPTPSTPPEGDSPHE